MSPTIQEFILQAPKNLILLVQADVAALEGARETLSKGNDWPSLSIGQALSAAMISGQVGGPMEVQAWLADQVRDLAPGPVLVHGIDLLFEPSYSLDPLVLFQKASRLTRLIVLWPGTYSNPVLAYAVPAHGHYRTWRNPEAAIRNL